MSIQKQISSEYAEGRDFLSAKKTRQVSQLRLLNNLRRGDQNISSSMLFSFFTRVFSNLYDDNIEVKFQPGEDSDYKRTESLNKLAVNDFREMDKSLVDYDWLWDTLFFGRGYCETLKFNKERKILEPLVINPLMLVYDPFFSEVNNWRYYGKWILRSSNQIQDLINKKVIKGISRPDEIPSGVESELWDYKVRREAAKEGTAPTPETASPNALYQILEFYTHINGKKHLVWTDKSFSKILYKKELKLEAWPLVVKEAFREPHSSLSVSVPDIVEDKHRALNVLYNLSYIAAKDEANPLYAYDVNRIKDVTQLFNRQINQHIPVEGDPQSAVQPLRSSAALTQSLLQFIGIIKSEAAEVVGTTQVSAPIQRGKKTATEASILQQIADLSQSLQSKVLGIGEKEFWGHWYQRYIENKEQGDEKIIALTSVTGVKFETIKLDEIKTKYPPKVLIVSKKEAEMKEMIARRDFMALFPVFGQSMDPNGFKNFLKHVFFPKFDIDSSTVDLIIPKSLEAIKAQEENEMLNKNKLPSILPTDDDETHLYEHAMAKNTAATWAHRFSHEKQLAWKKQFQQMMQQQEMVQQLSGGQRPRAGGQQRREQAREQEVGAEAPQVNYPDLGM